MHRTEASRGPCHSVSPPEPYPVTGGHAPIDTTLQTYGGHKEQTLSDWPDHWALSPVTTPTLTHTHAHTCTQRSAHFDPGLGGGVEVAVHLSLGLEIEHSDRPLTSLQCVDQVLELTPAPHCTGALHDVRIQCAMNLIWTSYTPRTTQVHQYTPVDKSENTPLILDTCLCHRLGAESKGLVLTARGPLPLEPLDGHLKETR